MYYKISKYLEGYAKMRGLVLESWQTIAPNLVAAVFKKCDFSEDTVYENVNIHQLRTA
jgi:hypothetical protein